MPHALPMVTLGSMETTAAAPTDKQISFVTKLLAERPMWANVENYHMDNILKMDRKHVSQVIDAALKMPKESAAKPAPKSVTVTQEGFYFLDGDIVRVKAGKWNPDRLHASLLVANPGAKGHWEYTSGLVFKLTPEMLLTREEAILFGHDTGICGICGAELTNTTTKGKDGLTSVERGIGPVCAARLGWL